MTRTFLLMAASFASTILLILATQASSSIG